MKTRGAEIAAPVAGLAIRTEARVSIEFAVRYTDLNAFTRLTLRIYSGL
jgi:hypothetical protein